jgi:hypothetical protein
LESERSPADLDIWRIYIDQIELTPERSLARRAQLSATAAG